MNRSSKLRGRIKRRFFLIGLATLVFVGIVFFVIWQWGPARNTGLSCKELSPEERMAQADLIVTGSVFAVVPGPEGGDVLITVDRALKGTVPPRGVTIAALDASKVEPTKKRTGANELHFASDQPPYILYLLKRSDGRFSTSRCYGSKFLYEGLNNEEMNLLSKS